MFESKFSNLPARKTRITILLSLLGIAIIGLSIKIYYIQSSVGGLFLKAPRPGIIHDPDYLLIKEDGKNWLYGGSGETEKNFDVTTLDINPGQLHYGIGREHFPALFQPEFISSSEADEWLSDEDTVLAVKMDDEVKVYPIKLLLRHEIINDVVGGRPVFAAYCYLADLGAVYDREYAGNTLTFGLSGFTYFDPEIWDGRDAFVFWDRETESLWWPPIGRAVSGKLNGVKLKLLEPELWSQSKWSDVKTDYPHAAVLKPGQGFLPPDEWESFDEEVLASIKQEQIQETIAPRWGENAAIGEGIKPVVKPSVSAGSGTWR